MSAINLSEPAAAGGSQQHLSAVNRDSLVVDKGSGGNQLGSLDRSKSESNLAQKMLKFSVSMDNLLSDTLTISFVGDCVNISSSSKILAKSSIDISANDEGTTLRLRPAALVQDEEESKELTDNKKDTKRESITGEVEEQVQAGNDGIKGAELEAVKDLALANSEFKPVDSGVEFAESLSSSNSDLLVSPPPPPPSSSSANSSSSNTDNNSSGSNKHELSVFFEEISSVDTVIENLGDDESSKQAAAGGDDKFTCELPPPQLYYFNEADLGPDDVSALAANAADSGSQNSIEMRELSAMTKKFSESDTSLVLSTSGSHENIIEEEVDGGVDRPMSDEEGDSDDQATMDELIDAEFNKELDDANLSNETLNSLMLEDEGTTLFEGRRGRYYNRRMLARYPMQADYPSPPGSSAATLARPKKLLRFSPHQVN